MRCRAGRICVVQIQPRKDVLNHADHADYTAPTRQHELDHTDHTYHTDHTHHTDQESTCSERSICPIQVIQTIRLPHANRSWIIQIRNLPALKDICVLGHPDYTAPTRQHELDHTDHTDHTDQELIYLDHELCLSGNRSYRSSVRCVLKCPILYFSMLHHTNSKCFVPQKVGVLIKGLQKAPANQ